MVTIVITLKYLCYVLPFLNEPTIDKDLQNQIQNYVVLWYVIEFLIDSKTNEIIVCKIRKQ